jgi:subtilase family serine protease
MYFRIIAIACLVTALAVSLVTGTLTSASSSASASASRISEDRFVLHERSVIPSGWQKNERTAPNTPITFYIALRQHNLDKLESVLNQVSHPDSPKWLEYLTPKQIAAIVAPPLEQVVAVRHWIEAVHLMYARSHLLHIESHYGDALRVTTVARVAESLFSTQLYNFELVDNSNSQPSPQQQRYKHVTCAMGTMTIPQSLRGVIEMITQLSDFPMPRSEIRFSRTSTNEADTVQNNNYVIPAGTKLLSRIPSDTIVTHSSVTQAAVEFGPALKSETGQDGGGGGGFVFNDIIMFGQQTDGQPLNISHIQGPFEQLNYSSTAESCLDVEYILHVAPGAPTTYATYFVWMYEFALENAADANSPLVHSLSYATAEQLMCNTTLNGVKNPTCGVLGVDYKGYIQRANTELMKLGVRGISVVSASGDNGAPSEENKLCLLDGSPSRALNPLFPATSPYVTAVGGVAAQTQYQGSRGEQPEFCQRSGGYCLSTPYELQVSMNTNGGITSGGGFSNVIPQPSFQKDAVASFLASSAFRPPSQFFNENGRAYPDISLLASQILIGLQGQVLKGAGTSASTPMVAAILSLINDHLASRGFSSIGWFNPALYDMASASPETIFDVAIGNNTCTELACCKYGYGAAAQKWDPATGWGVPNFPEIIKYIDAKLDKKLAAQQLIH